MRLPQFLAFFDLGELALTRLGAVRLGLFAGEADLLPLLAQRLQPGVLDLNRAHAAEAQAAGRQGVVQVNVHRVGQAVAQRQAGRQAAQILPADHVLQRVAHLVEQEAAQVGHLHRAFALHHVAEESDRVRHLDADDAARAHLVIIPGRDLGDLELQRDIAAVHQQARHVPARAQGEQLFEQRVHGVAARPLALLIGPAVHQQDDLLAGLHL